MKTLFNRIDSAATVLLREGKDTATVWNSLRQSFPTVPGDVLAERVIAVAIV